MMVNKIPLILLVEDDRLAMYSIALGLREAGYQVMEANSAEEAAPLCEKILPDLAILDMKLPGMSGVVFAAWLTNTHNVPFIFLSAFNDAEIVDSAVALGALGYLVKPLDVPQILPTIRTALLRAKELKQIQQSEQEMSSALADSRIISTAVGLLMSRFAISENEAFNAFRSYCRDERKRVVDVAKKVVTQRQEIDLSPYLKK